MDGFIHKKKYLSLETQNNILKIIKECAEITPFYIPQLTGKPKMNLHRLSLGMHWNPQIDAYQDYRGDGDKKEVIPIPPYLLSLARSGCESLWGKSPRFDICIINKYLFPQGKLEQHQDKDEDELIIESGSPVFSISIGEDAKFFASSKKSSREIDIIMSSGDVIIFGGKARLCHHGVERIIPNTAPSDLELNKFERYNLTFRQCTL